MSQSFEEVIRLKLESLGLEKTDAWVEAFSEIARSGQLTEEQLSGLVGDFTKLTDVLRDTSAAQAAVSSYKTLAEQQQELGRALDYAALKWQTAIAAEQSSAAILDEKRAATAQASAALAEYGQSLDANRAGLAQYKKLLAEAKKDEQAAAREYRASASAVREAANEYDKAADAQEKLTRRMDGLSEIIREAGGDVDDLGAAQALLAERADAAAAGMENLRESAQNTVESQRKIAEATREAEAAIEELAEAHKTLGTRPFGDIDADIAKVQKAYETLAKSGTLSTQALAQAKSRLIERTRELEKETNGVVGAMGKVKLSLAAAGASLVGVAAKLADATREAADFSTAMGRISTIAESSEMDGLTRGVRELGQEFGNVGKQADGAYALLSAGAKNAAEAMHVLRIANELAIGAVTDVDTAARGIQATINAFGMSADRAREVSDKFFASAKAGATDVGELADNIGRIAPLAASTGVSLDELLAAVASLTNGGQSTSEAITSLVGVLSAVVKPTGEAARMAQQLGLEFNTAALRSRDLSEFLRDVAEKTGGSEEKLAALFGRIQGLQGVLALTGAQADDFSDSLKTVNNSAGDTAAALEKMKDTPEEAWKRFNGAIADVKIELGSMINEFLIPTINQITNLISAFNSLDTGVKQAALVIGGVTAVAVPAVFAVRQLQAALVLMGGVLKSKTQAVNGLVKSLSKASSAHATAAAAARTHAASLTGLVTNVKATTTAVAALSQALAVVGTAFAGFHFGVKLGEKLNEMWQDVPEKLAEIRADWELTAGAARHAQQQYQQFADVVVKSTDDMVRMSQRQRDSHLEQLRGLEQLTAAQLREINAKRQLGAATDDEISRYGALKAKLAEVREAQLRVGEAAVQAAEAVQQAADSGLTPAAVQIANTLKGVVDDAERTRDALSGLFSNIDTSPIRQLGDVALAIASVGESAGAAGARLRDELSAELGKLSGAQLLKFSSAAQAAFDEFGTSATRAATVSETVLMTAMTRLGLKGAQLGVPFTEAGNDIAATFQVVAESASASGEQIANAFRSALSSVDTKAEAAALETALQQAFEAGRLSADEFSRALVALGVRLTQIEAQADPLRASFELLGITSQRALASTASASKAAFDDIVRAARSGRASLEDARAAFESYARAQLAAVANSDQATRQQVESMLRLQGAVIGAKDALERLGLVGRDSPAAIVPSANRGEVALHGLADAADKASGSLGRMGDSAENAGHQLDGLANAAGRQAASLGEVSAEAAKAYADMNRYAGKGDLWSKMVNGLTARINEQRDAWQKEVDALGQAAGGYEGLAEYIDRVRTQYRYMSDEQVKHLAQLRKQADEARAAQEGMAQAEGSTNASLSEGNELLRERSALLNQQQNIQQVQTHRHEVTVNFTARSAKVEFDVSEIPDSVWRQVADKVIGIIKRDMQ